MSFLKIFLRILRYMMKIYRRNRMDSFCLIKEHPEANAIY